MTYAMASVVFQAHAITIMCIAITVHRNVSPFLVLIAYNNDYSFVLSYQYHVVVRPLPSLLTCMDLI